MLEKQDEHSFWISQRLDFVVLLLLVYTITGNCQSNPKYFCKLYLVVFHNVRPQQRFPGAYENQNLVLILLNKPMNF